jgi:hypothetical protein
MDNIIAIETNGLTVDRQQSGAVYTPEASTIKVITQFPHGFAGKSTFMMGNSIGQKNVDFNAKLIHVTATVTKSMDIATTSNNPTGAGYLTKSLNPYDFQSKRTYFFGLGAVNGNPNNIYQNYIYYPNHGLVSGQFLMYVSPINDTPIDGLQNYKLYYVNKLDTNRISLSNVLPYFYSGLDYIRYNFNYPSTSVPANIYNNSANKVPADFTGNSTTSYRWGDSTNLNSTKLGTAATNFGVNGIGSTTTWSFNSTITNQSIEFKGYFYAQYTGTHKFKIKCTAAGYLWVGDSATFSFNSQMGTYNDITTPGRPGAIATKTWTPAPQVLGIGGTVIPGATYNSNELSIYLTSNQMIPIRMHFSIGSATSYPLIEFSYKLPWFNNINKPWEDGCNVGTITTVGDSLYRKTFLYSSGRYESAISAVGMGSTNYFGYGAGEAPWPGATTKAYYRFTPLVLGNQGGSATSNYGVHSLHKAYLINGYCYNAKNAVLNKLNINYDITNYDGSGPSSASITSGLYLGMFSGDVITGSNSFGINYVPITVNNYGGKDAYNNKYNLATTTAAGGAGQTPTTSSPVSPPYFWKTAEVPISTLTTNPLGYKINSVNWIVPASDVPYKNSFYAPSHGFASGNKLIFNNTGGWGSLPGGIVNSTQYTADVPDVNYFRVKDTSTLQVIDLLDFPNTKFSVSTSVPDPYAYRIIASGHDFTSNTPVYYSPGPSTLTGVSPNTIYYVSKPTADSFNLAATVDGNRLNINHAIAADEYHSVRTVLRGRTDGNYIIDSTDGIDTTDPYSFSFITKDTITGDPVFGIPNYRIPFNPRVALDQQSNLFYIPDHRLRTGSRVIYNITASAGGAIGGLTAGNSYLVIRVDENRFRLSSINANTIVGTGVTSGPYISAWNTVNANPLSGFVTFSADYNTLFPNTVNEQGKAIWSWSCNYHYFDVPSLGGDITYPKPLLVSNSCNLVQNAVAGNGIDFTSITKLGGTIGIRYPDRSNAYLISSVGIGSSITLNALTPHSFVTGDAVIYKTPYTAPGTPLKTGIVGLSNNYVYYVGIGTTTNTIISALFASSNDAVGGTTSFYTFTSTANPGYFVKPISGQVDYYTITDINSKDAVTVDRDIVLPSWMGNTDNTNARIMLSTGLYPRLDSYIQHRAYNGGVEIVPSLCPFTKISRQTRKYFRYQAGKGIQLSKAINFSAPVKFLVLKLITDSTDTRYKSLYAQTRTPHRLTSGVSITIQNADLGDADNNVDYWNGVYTVTDIDPFDPTIFYLTPNSYYDFTSSPPTLPNPTYAGGFPEFIVNGWSRGSSYVRVGMFDEQNGIFFEYDGVDLHAVRRNTTKQLTGTASVQYNSAQVTGTNTAYASTNVLQAASPGVPGSMICIRGVSYRVVYIESDSVMYIQPPYRGVDATNVIVSITIDTKTPTSQWSIDHADGTGPSGFIQDIHKIQMMYIDYSWYGAGKVRYGFKGVDGEVKYMHEYIHNNVFTEAYIRAGNLAARYEVENGAIPEFAPALLHWGTSVIMDGKQDKDKEFLFTASGKQINYNNKDTTDFFLTYSGAANNAGNVFKLGPGTSSTMLIYLGTNAPPGTFITATRTFYDLTKNINVTGYTLWWGPSTETNSAALFAQLKLYGPGIEILNINSTYFAAGTKLLAYPELVDGYYYMYVNKLPTGYASSFYTGSAVNVGFRLGLGTQSLGLITDTIPLLIPLVSIRLSPSVDNGRPALLGQREVVNRMQVELTSAGIQVSHDCEILFLLNGNPFYKNFVRLPAPSLVQAIFHEKGETIQGGLSIYTVRVTGGAADANGKRSLNLNVINLDNIATLGNSIIGGNGTYPDGPDLLTIAARPLDLNNIGAFRPITLSARISWKEAQA